MFRKKKDDDGGAVRPGSDEAGTKGIAAPPLKPFSRKGSHHLSRPPSAPGVRPEAQLPRRSPDAPVAPRRIERGRPGETESKKLIVGRDICLSGEITSCNRLIVEGRVEASLSAARAIEIAPTGYFKGSADVEEADISGLYEGELVARDKLTVRSSGRIQGSIRYGRIVIESGGEISGDMRALSQEEQDQIEAEAEAPEAPDAEPAAAADADEDLVPSSTAT